ncbi:MAG: response regulator [Clostridiales bacterium]|nr:response regulator [Clostridiales bacterium]
MKKKNLTIGAQLLIGFSFVLAFVIVLGVVSSIQTNRLYQREKTLYEHPLQVKEAIDEIKNDIQESRIAIRDFILFDDENKQQAAQQAVQLSFSDIEKQFDVLYALYLGPMSDVDNAYSSFEAWRFATQNRMDMAEAGDFERIIDSLGDQGDVGNLRIELMSDISVIDDFASNKANELNTSFAEYYQSLTTSQALLISAILILSALISIYLTQMIRKPLSELTLQIGRFREGELTARSHYSKGNEFGTLSASFNSMANAIQADLELSEKTSHISDVMLRHEELKGFFRSMLEELAKQFSANTAAVYLLSDDKKKYVCYDSIGLSGKARGSFDAQTPEGEFGMVLTTRRPQFICRMQEDETLRFPISSGELSPREIITIPIVSGDTVIAVISMTCINRFFEHSDKLIENVTATMSARIEGVLAFQTIKDILQKMELQNRELDAQKNELTAQADELMQQNAELDMQSNQLAEASRLKTTFLSNMSHELRTPLNSIIALSGVLTRRLTNQIPEEEISYLEIVERNGRHLLSLINDILDISRIEAGREEIELTEFGIAGILADIKEMLDPIAAQKGIELVYQAPENDIYLSSDERKCRHILQNIIGNAVKFTETGSVKVTTRAEGDFVKITVKDTGIGIAKEHLASIFDEFQQADGSTSRKYGGSGLGLAIARKYAELLDGSISVKSALGVGSEFVISLPIAYGNEIVGMKPAQAARDVRPAVAERPAPQGTGSTGKTLLIVEDSEPAIIQIKDLIERTGHKILIARSAVEAYRIVDEVIPDAIILDLMMPEIDGFETLNALRASEKTANVPVLILTAKHITNEELGQLKRNHISQVVQKGGINGSDFIAAVTNMFQKNSGPVKEAFAVSNTDQTARSDEQAQRKEGKPLVLVVEDNMDNRTTVRALLMDAFCVIDAENGEQGIELAKTKKPDLILMDIALGSGISGIDAFHAIRNAPATCRIPIIALTASAMVQERSSILAHGFEAFVAKPIQLDELLKAIQEVLYDR